MAVLRAPFHMTALSTPFCIDGQSYPSGSAMITITIMIVINYGLGV